MLARAYRLTDKLGVVILKSSVALSDVTLAGLTILRQAFGGGLGGIAGLLKRIALAVWSVIRFILSVLGGTGLFFFSIGRRVTRRAGSGAVGVMARRAARAEMQAGLAEDPLRAQNRVLSGLTVLLLLALIGVVLWATNPSRSSPLPVNDTAPLANNNPPASDAGNLPLPTPTVPRLATPVPIATALPAALEVRGTLAYTVRERGQTDIWALPVGSRTPIRLTNDPADDRDPAWSPNGRFLAFASHRDGNWEIYVEDINTQNIQRMTYDLSFQARPQWSPDGEWLVYESYQGNNLDITIMKVDQSQPPLRLPGNSAAPDFSPAWSPDGRQIAFVSWRDGNQDIYIFSLNDQTTINLTSTPDREEDYPAWSPDGKWIAYSAVDDGLEKVFVKSVAQPDNPAQVMAVGHNPSWSPDGSSLVFAVDSPEDNSTQLIADPFAGSGGITPIIPVQLGATQPVWTAVPLPQALVNSGGLGPAVPGPLYVEQEQRFDGDAPYKFNSITDVQVQSAFLSDRVNDSFNALRQRALQEIGWDFLGKLDDAFWALDRPPQPGEERHSWHMAGRAFSVTRSSLLGFPAPMEVVREDVGVDTYWHVYIRVSDSAQAGQLGEPLRRMPWNFAAAGEGDVQAYDQGGRLMDTMPDGYYVDLTALAADYGWDRAAAGTDWRANSNSRNFWEFERHDGLSWYEAMRELYSDSQLGGFAPTATPLPTLIPTQSGS